MLDRFRPVSPSALLLAFCLSPSAGCDRASRPLGPAVLLAPAPSPAEQLEATGRWAEAAASRRDEAFGLGPEKWDESVKHALTDYLMADRLEDAERFAAECLERSPQSHEVLFYLGDSQRVLMQYEAARATLEKLLSKAPGHAKGSLVLAHVLARLGRHAEALPLFERFLASAEAEAPRELRAVAEIDRARSLRRLGRNEESADAIAAVLEADPFHTVALAEAVQTFSLLGKHELARGLREMHAWLFERGHQLSSEGESKVYRTIPAWEGAQEREALQAADRRDFVAATRKLGALLAAQPADATLAAPLARLWLRLFRFHDALRVAEGVLGRGVEWADLLRASADASIALGRTEDARKALRRAFALLASRSADDPGLVLETHQRSGLLELEPGGSPEDAAACFERARAIAPGDWRPLYGSGRAEIEKGDARKALELLGAARTLAVKDPGGPADLRRWTAVAKGLSGDLRSAAREIMELVHQSPEDLENFKAFERVFGSRRNEQEVVRVLEMKKRLEERAEAKEAALRAVSDAPFASSAQGYLALGRLLLAEGSREKALDVLFLAADLEPTGTEALRLAAGALTGPNEAFLRLRALRRLLELAPDDPESLAAAARLYVELGLRLDEAESLALRLMKARPGDESAKLLAAIRERRKPR